jgi:Mg-chelatase subunit ChlD
MTRHTSWLHRLLFTLAVAPWSWVGCGGGPVSDFASGTETNSYGDDDGSESAGDDGDDSASAGEGSSVGQGGGQAGILTAGAWDDNRNYEHFLSYREPLADRGLAGMLDFRSEEHDTAHQLFGGERPGRVTLDVALVIDTTGSMGDEISYLRDEFTNLSSAVAQKFPDSTQRWALIVYKDEGDEYVVRSVDFTPDAEEFRNKLAEQSAGGGGDFPEAPDAALARLAQLQWRAAAKTARLAFWVADAPHHDEKAGAMSAAVRAAREQDVHIYPVASSGIDELTELTMRSAAQLTGGRYLFLTDDSGVGGAHKEPSIPCYFVTRLEKAIQRMIDIELSGSYAEPAAADVIRKGGDPQNGACELASGEIVQPF